MSASAMVWAYDQKCPTPIDKFVLLSVADNEVDGEGLCVISFHSICRKCQLSLDEVKDSLGGLESACLIQRVAIPDFVSADAAYQLRLPQ